MPNCLSGYRELSLRYPWALRRNQAFSQAGVQAAVVSKSNGNMLRLRLLASHAQVAVGDDRVNIRRQVVDPHSW